MNARRALVATALGVGLALLPPSPAAAGCRDSIPTLLVDMTPAAAADAGSGACVASFDAAYRAKHTGKPWLVMMRISSAELRKRLGQPVGVAWQTWDGAVFTRKVATTQLGGAEQLIMVECRPEDHVLDVGLLLRNGEVDHFSVRRVPIETGAIGWVVDAMIEHTTSRGEQLGSCD